MTVYDVVSLYQAARKGGKKMIKKIIIDGHELLVNPDIDFKKLPKEFDGAFSSPMLVSEIPGHRDRISSEPYVFVQPKLDGWCCMANTRTRKIYTRSGREITTLPHIQAALPVDGPEWLHGELYIHRVWLDNIQSMIKNGNLMIEFHVFDLVDAELAKARFSYLYSKWHHLSTCTMPIKLVETYEIMPEQIEDYYERFLSAGYEGIIIRLDGHGYEHKRSANVFKMKPGTEGM